MQTMRMRAASLAVSGLSLGFLGLVALTATYSVRQVAMPDPPGIRSFVEMQPKPTTPTTAPIRPLPLPHDASVAANMPSPATDAVPMLLAVETSGLVPGPVVIADPQWARRPVDLERYYPRRAHQMGIQGEVVLDCLVTLTGSLQCAVVSEAPQNRGFADAALRISREHRMVPAMRDGGVVEARYRMRVPFRVQ